MKNLFYLFFCMVSLSAHAQIVVDADLKEWGDSLRNYDAENKLHYEMRQDSANLYIAIFKDDNAIKAYIQGGVQLVFDSISVMDKSFRVVFGHSFADPIDKQTDGNRHDYFELQNFQNKKSMILPIYNEYGIMAVYNFKSDRSHLPKSVDGIIHSRDIGKDKSIYQAEIVIPLIYIPRKDGQVNYSICLRGVDLEKKGEQYYRMGGIIQDSPYLAVQERNELKYFTEHFGILKLLY